MADEPKQCCMCVEDLTMENIVTTECNHQFCKDCFWRWIKTKNSCPFCRKSLLKTDEEQSLFHTVRTKMNALMNEYHQLYFFNEDLEPKNINWL